TGAFPRALAAARPPKQPPTTTTRGVFDVCSSAPLIEFKLESFIYSFLNLLIPDYYAIYHLSTIKRIYKLLKCYTPILVRCYTELIIKTYTSQNMYRRKNNVAAIRRAGRAARLISASILYIEVVIFRSEAIRVCLIHAGRGPCGRLLVCGT